MNALLLFLSKVMFIKYIVLALQLITHVYKHITRKINIKKTKLTKHISAERTAKVSTDLHSPFLTFL